jgi:hypothetical protein
MSLVIRVPVTAKMTAKMMAKMMTELKVEISILPARKTDDICLSEVREAFDSSCPKIKSSLSMQITYEAS